MQFTEATSTVTIDASLVARALPFRAYNDVRYYLNGVLIEPEPTGGVNVIATDGHAMICLHDPAGRATRRLILPIGKAQATPLRKGGKLHATSDGRAYITGEGGEILWICPELEIEGKYPNTKELVGNVADYVPGFVAAMNPALLARLHEARPRGCGIARPVAFFHRPSTARSSAVLVTFGQDGFALLMPMRASEAEVSPGASVPASFRAQVQEKKAA
jgi:DNA polymerase sliding clamp subunit (PCNA homolog)